MNRNNLANEAWKWSEKLPADLTSHPPTASAIAASLVLTKNWARLKRRTRGGSWGDDDYQRLAYQAYATRGARRGAAETEFDSLWASAVKAASANPERELALARLASKWDLARQAEPLWQRVSNTAASRREALDALYKIYRAANDLPNLRVIARRLHEARRRRSPWRRTPPVFHFFSIVIPRKAVPWRSRLTKRPLTIQRPPSPMPLRSTAPEGRARVSMFYKNSRPISCATRIPRSTPRFFTTPIIRSRPPTITSPLRRPDLFPGGKTIARGDQYPSPEDERFACAHPESLEVSAMIPALPTPMSCQRLRCARSNPSELWQATPIAH